MKYRKEDVRVRRLNLLLMFMALGFAGLMAAVGLPAWFVGIEVGCAAIYFLATFILPSKTTLAIYEEEHKMLTAKR